MSHFAFRGMDNVQMMKLDPSVMIGVFITQRGGSVSAGPRAEPPPGKPDNTYAVHIFKASFQLGSSSGASVFYELRNTTVYCDGAQWDVVENAAVLAQERGPQLVSGAQGSPQQQAPQVKAKQAPAPDVEGEGVTTERPWLVPVIATCASGARCALCS